MKESEIWKDVAEYEGFYQVSNKGNVRSVERRDSRGCRRRGRILKPKYGGKGYHQVNMYQNGKLKTKSVHRLVAGAFIPNPKGFLEVNHKDENKSNNESSNLEWCTHKYNMNHGTLKERTAQALSKKVKATNIITGEVLTFNSTKEAEKKGYHNVSAPCRGVYNTSGHLYKGYRWEYYEQAEENESK